jgi:hypothetical protein
MRERIARPRWAGKPLQIAVDGLPNTTETAQGRYLVASTLAFGGLVSKHVQRKVPTDLQVIVAQVENRKRKTPKARQVYLRRSLGTDNKREATHRAKHVLAELDQILNEARALANHPGPARRDGLNAAEIARMSEAFFAKMLADDEAFRFGGQAYMAQTVEWIRRNEDPNFEPPYALETLPEFGWTPEELAFQKQREAEELETMREALAMGDITAVQDDVALLLANFDISLDRNSASYRQLGIAVLRAYVRGLEAIAKRSAGEVIETPKAPLAPAAPTNATSGTLREALEGWKKERARPEDGVHEYTRAVEMFIELHGKSFHRRHQAFTRQPIPRRAADGAQDPQGAIAEGGIAGAAPVGPGASKRTQGLRSDREQAAWRGASHHQLCLPPRPCAR